MKLEEALEALIDALATRVAEKLREPSIGVAGWIDQHSSPLGPRQHIRIVRKRLGEGKEGASQQGRRFLLASAALAEEFQASKGKRRQKALSPDELEAQEVRASLTRELAALHGMTPEAYEREHLGRRKR